MTALQTPAPSEGANLDGATAEVNQNTPILPCDDARGNGAPIPVGPLEKIRPAGVNGLVQPVENLFRGQFLTLQQLYDLPDTEDWLIEDFISRGELVMVFGESFCGKTYVCLDIIFALATGESWCGGLLTVPQPRLCIYAYGEGRRGISKRLYARHTYYREQGGKAEPSIIVIPRVPQLFNSAASDGAVKFIEECKRITEGQEIGVIAIDTLSRASCGADENSAKDAGIIIATAEMIQREMGATVLLDHHANRNGAYRGSTAFRGAMDSILEVKKLSENRHVLHLDKLKDGDEFGDQAFHFFNCEQSSVIAWDGESRYTGETLADKLAGIMPGEPEKWWMVRELSNLTGKSSRQIRDTLDRQTAKFESRPLHPDREQKKGSNNNPTVYRLKCQG